METKERNNLYHQVYRTKQRIKQLQAQRTAQIALLPKNLELQNAVRKYYQKKIDLAEEKLSKLLILYYEL